MIKILTEGMADEKFLKDYLKFLGIDSGYSITSINGIDEQMNTIYENAPNFRQITEQGGQNIVIFDADTSIDQRKKAIEEKRSEQQLEFEYFLLPNNQDNGNLENLLCEIINPANKPLLNCFDQYCSCLTDRGHRAPGLKSKIYAYLETLYGNENDKRLQYGNRDYLNTDHWDLTSSYLIPLKDFLLRHIQPSAV